MIINVETKRVKLIKWSEFDELVRDTFPQASDYEFVADEEASNDNSYYYPNIKAEPLDDYHQKALDEGNLSYKARYVLQELVNRRLLQSGNYLIWVCW